MIEDKVRITASKFVARWSKLSEKSKLFALDYSWPSIGTIDLITYPLRGKSKYTEEEKELIKGCASYIGLIADTCLSKIFTSTVLSDDSKRGIKIVFFGGEVLKDGEQTISIEKELTSILMLAPNPFPVLSTFSRPITGEENLVSLFALGVFTGLSPFGRGKLKEYPIEEYKAQTDEVVKYLSLTTASYFEKCFPDLELSHVAELYLNNLIYPPVMLNEVLPAINSTNGVVEFAKSFNVGKKSLLKLAVSLSSVPDEVISSTGIAVYGALAKGELSKKVIAASLSRGDFTGILRSAMYSVRESMGLVGDWLLNEQFDETDEKAFRAELELGFIPWVWIRPNKKNFLKYQKILTFLTKFDFQQSMSGLDLLISENPKDIDLRLQRIYLEGLLDNFEEMEKSLRDLLTEPGAENSPRLYDLLGACEVQKDNLKEANKLFKKAFNLISSKTLRADHIANNFLTCMLLSENYNDVLKYANDVIKISPNPVSPMLNKSFALFKLNKEEELIEIENELFELAPIDRRVFFNLTKRCGL